MSKRLITVRSGNEEIQMEVTEEEYQKYYRPWWQQKKREQRNREAMDSLLPDERELASKVFGEDVSICEYARMKGENKRTLAFRKGKVLEKLRDFFKERGFDI